MKASLIVNRNDQFTMIVILGDCRQGNDFDCKRKFQQFFSNDPTVSYTNVHCFLLRLHGAPGAEEDCGGEAAGGEGADEDDGSPQLAPLGGLVLHHHPHLPHHHLHHGHGHHLLQCVSKSGWNDSFHHPVPVWILHNVLQLRTVNNLQQS